MKRKAENLQCSPRKKPKVEEKWNQEASKVPDENEGIKESKQVVEESSEKTKTEFN